ncbi:SHOCT domain-containing protein [Halorarum halophilum]|uniref:SHOCT domain-containing protein n=1 Tax=Halorarum halophilum TaxID=2743090 RepID=A0A7D5KMJ2_9EURY|nr:SHOCT domain-containing protein [Halobaculum halophilum]
MEAGVGERDVADGDGADGDRPVDVPNPWWGTWETREPDPSDPLDRLCERYAEGEIDEAEFERRLGLLLDTEDTDPATARERLREHTGRND